MQLARYESAKQALAEYKTVDEVKDFRDKALAVEAYAKQANDFDLEYDAATARVRAERKCGELLSAMDKAKGVRLNGKSDDGSYRWSATTTPEENPKTLNEMGVTKDQSSKWQKLAAVPEEEFEAAISLPGAKPSTNHILKKPASEPEPKRMNSDALWWWGRLCEMERNHRFNISVAAALEEMTDAMRRDTERLLPRLKAWLEAKDE